MLVLGPNKEICEQNYSKYLLTGEPASIYSASVGRKETKHNVVFGSPLTVINDISKFNNYAANISIKVSCSVIKTPYLIHILKVPTTTLMAFL